HDQRCWRLVGPPLPFTAAGSAMHPAVGVAGASALGYARPARSAGPGSPDLQSAFWAEVWAAYERPWAQRGADRAAHGGHPVQPVADEGSRARDCLGPA